MTASHNLNQFCPFRTIEQRISLFSEQVGQVYFVTKRTLITANQTTQLVFANLTSRIEENLLIITTHPTIQALSKYISIVCKTLWRLQISLTGSSDFVISGTAKQNLELAAELGVGGGGAGAWGVGSNDRWWREKLGSLGKTPGNQNFHLFEVHLRHIYSI